MGKYLGPKHKVLANNLCMLKWKKQFQMIEIPLKLQHTLWTWKGFLQPILLTIYNIEYLKQKVCKNLFYIVAKWIHETMYLG